MMNFSPLAELERIDKRARRLYRRSSFCYLAYCLVLFFDIIGQFIRPSQFSEAIIITCVVSIFVIGALYVRLVAYEMRRRRESKKWWVEYRRVWGNDDRK